MNTTYTYQQLQADDFRKLWIRITLDGYSDVERLLPYLAARSDAHLTFEIIKESYPQYLDLYEKILLLR
jgi:hypothetical protein